MTFTAPAALVGGNVRAELARRGISQATLARELGLPQTSVSARLRGVTPFDVNELARVASVLEVSVETLLAGVVTAPV